MSIEAIIQSGTRSLLSLAPAVSGLEQYQEATEDVETACARGYFRPEEEERIQLWFAYYLTARNGLLETVFELRPIAFGKDSQTPPDEEDQYRAFVIGYTAACLLVRAGRFLVERIAKNPITIQKLNEPARKYRIPSNQFTSIFRSLTSPLNAWFLNDAMAFAQCNRKHIESLKREPRFSEVLEYLYKSEPFLRINIQKYFTSRFLFRLHSWRRRRNSALQKALFNLLEASGRLISELRLDKDSHDVSDVYSELSNLLQPGDVLVTRHKLAMTNLFLPGFWPHAALYIGTEKEKQKLCIQMDAERTGRWKHPIRTLEALKDGVLFRPLEKTLSVDAVALIRPRLKPAQIAQALSRAVSHEGKLYNFDFNFFNSERLVCTEVVYRAYDGIGPMNFQLVSRNGRLSVSAEDLLDMALDHQGFEALAVFGTETSKKKLHTGPDVSRIIEESYRSR
ncbi:MAG TPA: hypothetical protein EYQ50_02255 [Verrucomicrobiales bacterium]|nr:hypothetical protein [Verrucomicrobiales bacterium]HIL70279.1 hypothetical protein [Verrucomicrobiota bacterium]